MYLFILPYVKVVTAETGIQAYLATFYLVLARNMLAEILRNMSWKKEELDGLGPQQRALAVMEAGSACVMGPGPTGIYLGFVVSRGTLPKILRKAGD